MLGEYLRQAASRPFIEGEHDCCTFPAGWAMTWGWGDPMLRWRGRYADEAGAEALKDAAGGLVALWMRGMADIGIHQVDDLREGDIGVIRAIGACGETEVGAVFNGRRWSFLTPAGLAHASADHVAAWGPRDG